MRDYQAAIGAMFERSITEARPSLREPQCEHRGNDARRVVDMLVETLAGFAVGIVTRDFARAVNAWFGAGAGALVHAAIPASKPLRRRATTDEIIDLPVKTVREHFAGDLRERLARTATELCATIDVVAARLLKGERSRAAEAMFGELARGAEYDDRLARELSIGWGCACAAIEHTPMPSIDASPRSRDLWRIWSELAGNPSPSESRQGEQRDGYIALVS
ncbi:MAG TPA: hypothetical protein VH143_24720 [Kofleriaceae bacterium]|jgi:hypothetical protein|nr:hypothetical protein [Kofleriaceae bacterium]